jgi:hypothetical protein
MISQNRFTGGFNRKRRWNAMRRQRFGASQR